MLAREADAMFWIGRYVERAEATARIVDVQYHSELEGAFPLADSGAHDADALWGPILAISGAKKLFTTLHGKDQSERSVLDFFAFDKANTNSIAMCVTRARENARGVREMISSEMYESLNMFYLEATRWNVDKILDTSPHAFFQQMKNASHLFNGITARTMPTGEARAFLDCGRLLERADKTARMLDVKYHILQTSRRAAEGPLDQHQWTAVLRSVGAYEAFRKTHRFGITPEKVVSYLVLNPMFPSSICYAISRARFALREIGGTLNKPPANRAERLMGRLRADLAYLTADEIMEGGLHEFLDQVQVRCIEIGSAISEAYLHY